MIEKKKVDTLIVGGGPGGRVAYMALSKMGKKNSLMVMNQEPTVVCSLPYGIGRRLIPGGPEDVVVDLSESPRLPKDIAENTIRGEVVSLDANTREALVRTGNAEISVSFEKALLAPGAVSWIPPVDGVFDRTADKTVPVGEFVQVGKDLVDKGRLAENVYVLRSANDARRLDNLARKATRAVIVGSGAIGLETAEALHDRGLKITIIETLPHVTAPLDADMAELVENRLAEKGVQVMTSQKVVAATEDGVLLESGEKVPGDGVVFATGVRPNVTLARKAGLEIEKGIVTDSRMQTSNEHVYAVGDAVQVSDAATGKPLLPLVGTLAMRQGVTAAANISGMPMEMPPATVWGVSAVFDIHWGSIGWTEELAKRENLSVRTIPLPVRTREEAMPSGKEGRWKIVVAVDRNEAGIKAGQILGFQIILDGESPLATAERFLDIVSSKETVPELFRHFSIHSPSHNPPDDPYLNLFMKYLLA
ncbi:MAG: FAD-dependent oxidoreductase [Thermovirgaceae bacterium]